jgi:hypothetical protein
LTAEPAGSAVSVFASVRTAQSPEPTQMSGRQWFISLLIVYHVVAVVVDAIPDPARMKPVLPEVRHPTEDAVASVLTPAFDRVAAWMPRLEPKLFAATEPLRWLTRPYIHAGLRQHWNMFTDVAGEDRYLRLDYYVQSGGSRPRRIQELVFPAGREDRVRVLHDFRDKAVINLLADFFDSQVQSPADVHTTDGLTPLVRSFTRQFKARELTDRDRVLRTEVWSGAAPIPPRGQAVPDSVLSARLEVLSSYYAGPVSSVVSGSASRVVGDREREADITWKLVGIQTP